METTVDINPLDGYHLPCSSTPTTHETYVQYFLEFFKQMPQNFWKILNNCFPGTTYIVI